MRAVSNSSWACSLQATRDMPLWRLRPFHSDSARLALGRQPQALLIDSQPDRQDVTQRLELNDERDVLRLSEACGGLAALTVRVLEGLGSI